MSRPREFDEVKVFNAAMVTFWRLGFAATKIPDLELATGLKRQSLYNVFGDKQELYRRTLVHYTEASAKLNAPLLTPNASLQQLRDWIENALAFVRSNECRACMVVLVAFEQPGQDPQIQSFASQLTKNGETTATTIVNINSIASLINFPLGGTHSASKAAAHSLTRALRRELPGTLVVGVYPGPVDTEMSKNVAMDKVDAKTVALAAP